ncbi:TonB-dependent vitamin B12 receptor BtuB [Enterobacteriaceae bacterium]
MIKKLSLLSALSVTAFSGWAQDSKPDTLVVTANRFQQPVNTVLAPTDVVTREQIDKWQSKTVLDVLRRLPGVDISQSGGMGQQASVYIRGTDARHALILMDGVPVPRPNLSNESNLYQIPAALIQRIEYIRGPRSAVYGSGAIGGVINIITESQEETSQIEAGVGSKGYQEYAGTLRQRFGDTVATAAGAYQTTKAFNVQPGSTWDHDGDRDGFRNKTFFGSLQHTFSDSVNGFFRGYGYANNIDYDVGNPPSSPAFSADENQYYNQSWDTGLRYSADSYSSQLIASFQKLKSYNYSSLYGRYHDGTTLDRMEQRYIQWGNNLIVGHGSVSAGVDWKQEKLTATTQADADSYKRDTTGLYLTGQQQVLDSVTLEASGREDHDEQFGWHGTWQTAAGWEFVEGYRATVSYGTGFLAPGLTQQFGSPQYGIASNPNLQPEESRQWEAGIEGVTGPLDWRVSTWRYKIDNLISYDNDGYYNVKSATIKGLEWTGNMATGPVNHQLTLQYIDPRDDETDERLLRRARKQVKYDISGDVANLGWDVTYQYIGERYDTNFNTFPSEKVKLGGISLWDLAVSYPVTSALTVRGKIANLFDKEYETVYGYATAGREYTLSGSYTF